MSAIGTKRTCRVALHMSAIGGKADMGAVPYRTSFKQLRCPVLSLGGGNETAR